MRLLELALASMILAAGCASTGGDKPDAALAAPAPLSSKGRANLELAQGYLGMNQAGKAAERAKMALATDPGSADAHAVLAMVAMREGDSKKAGVEFDRALKLDPDNGTILNVHASWLCESGQSAKADEEFARALQDPKYRSPAQALANAGKCALSAGQLAKAEGYFRRALEITPQDRSLLYLMADTELRLGKIMEAQAFIQRRDSLDADAQTLALAARIEDAAGDPLAAARYRKRLQMEFPTYLPTGEGAK
jgi:type IV pilus assembly protein PilF